MLRISFSLLHEDCCPPDIRSSTGLNSFRLKLLFTRGRTIRLGLYINQITYCLIILFELYI
jgi:hypothetical protein